jgi:hypothetical protein
MDPGELNRLGRLRVWTDQPNNMFGLDQTFDAGVPRWMKLDPIRGLVVRQGEQIGEQPTHFIWLRYSDQVRADLIGQTHVVEVLGRRFRVIDAINVGDAREWVRLTTKDIGPIA